VKGSWDIQDIEVDIIEDYEEIELDSVGNLEEQLADADGDGIADSKWIELDDITSSKGKPVYAAIRVVDNCAMLNVNTAYKFDETDLNLVDGSSQMQINLTELSQRGSNGTPDDAAKVLHDVRCNGNGSSTTIFEYQDDVVWRYYPPAKDTEYTPFDISDELELRNRFCLNNQYIKTRIEDTSPPPTGLGFWEKAYNWGLEVPRYSPEHSITEPNDWFWRTNNSSPDPDKYDYRHITTTYNMDRIIDPCGNAGKVRKMININEETDAEVLYETLVKSIDTDDPTDVGKIKKRYAQLAANLADFADK